MEINSVILESESRYSFGETIERIVQVAESSGWKLPTIHNLRETLQKAGTEVLDVQVLELCKPVYSGPLMQEDRYRFVSAIMPCRISVYVKSDGKAYVSRINTSLLSMFMGGMIGETMGQSGNDLELILRDILVEQPLPDF